MIRCLLGIHKWGKAKQWIKEGKPVLIQRCRHCGKFKNDN